ncbi:MAG: glycosyltransferase [Flavobacteriales bacterium]|nr:glycosyltransferase [Flavobacteriales bacterium]
MIYVNAMFSRVFTIYPILAAKGGDAKIVLAPRGMLAPSALQIKKRKKLLFLKLAKRFDVFASVSFHATNRVEADQVNKTFFRNKVVVLENVPTFREHEFQVNTPLKRSNMLNLYMVARVAPEKNIHFALHCLREIEGNNRVTLKVIGPIYDQSYFEGCKKIIARLKPNVTVEFLGPKTQNEILSIANQSDFFYLPTAGENYGHAIVEALLSNVPVIISNLTPWRNLQHHNLGFDLPLDPEKFTEAINNCASLSNNQYSKLYENIGVTAQSLININNLHKGYLKLFNGRD